MLLTFSSNMSSSIPFQILSLQVEIFTWITKNIFLTCIHKPSERGIDKILLQVILSIISYPFLLKLQC